MLTKDDLQAIEGIFDKSFDKKFGPAFDRKFDEKIKPIMKPIHKKLNKLQKDINTIVRVFDSNIVDLEKRMGSIEVVLRNGLI